MKQLLRVVGISQLEFIAGLFMLSSLVLYISFSLLNSGGYMTQYFDSLQRELPIVAQYHALSNEMNSSKLAGDIAIFIFWGIIGLLTYYVVYYLFLSEREAADFVRYLLRKNTDKVALVEYEFVCVGIRIIGAAGLLGIALLFQRVVLSYVLVVLNISQHTVIVDRLVEIILTAAILLLTFHIAIVLLRCILLKDRLL